MAKGLLLAAINFKNVAEDEFHDWYDTEHLPERERVPGFLNAQRWIGVEDENVSVAIYDLDTVDVLASPGYTAIGGQNLSPWSKRITAKSERLLRFEGVQTLPGDELAPSGAGALLLNAMNVSPEAEDDFNKWYDEEHIPALAAVPGTLCARRFRATESALTYVALYHLVSPDVVTLPEWKKAVGTPWTERIRPHMRDRLRVVCKTYKPRGL
ncbi:MAG: hypothetical protein ETSY1_16535 [Candidatus Entotheonella factor]|uniref:EthD domain-containing protein n=1 Tax=Entotheonella factor TaxID=1429438 RepID=W4LNP3_ENTF1|nr:MAG: hypothetical protein ETSY1_16535 [Candidatus Entotheonella factor]